MHPQAILLAGSVGHGESDHFSDLDLIVYYDILPPAEDLLAARSQIDGASAWQTVPRYTSGLIEVYAIHGVECQVCHALVADWEQEIATTLAGAEIASLSQKKLMGLAEGIALYGDDRIRCWQALAANYPAALARTTIEYYLRRIFPLWYFEARLVERDAMLWIAQELVESAQAILGILAGLNRLYFSPSQFKRLRRYIARMHSAPDNLADRLEGLFVVEPVAAIGRLEALVRDTLILVRSQMPEIDADLLHRKLGERERPWSWHSPPTPAPRS